MNEDQAIKMRRFPWVPMFVLLAQVKGEVVFTHFLIRNSEFESELEYGSAQLVLLRV